MKIGVVGFGFFSRDFVNLFCHHPDIEEVYVADTMPERVQQAKDMYPVTRTFSSLDDMLENAPELDCVAIFTQRHLHGKMVIQALNAGKHVYSAVPIGCTIDEIREIVKLVEEKHLIYMMGETCYYYPSAIYCREKQKEGAFGRFVYAEAQYYHDIREMYSDFKRSGGENWRRVAGIPPMFYPTHSISMILPAIGAHAISVSCLGLRDTFPDDIYGEEKNDFENPFSNESALFRLSDGSVMRINEFRRVGINKPSTYITCFYGDRGSYDCVTDHHIFQTAPLPDKNGVKQPQHVEDVSDQLMPVNYLKYKNGEIKTWRDREWGDDWSSVSVATIEGRAKIQEKEIARLPRYFREYMEKDTYHFNSHPFLVDDFVRAVMSGKLPPNNAWDSARYMVPGLVAHESALQGGVQLDIPDFGDAPVDWERLTYEHKDNYDD